MKAKTLLPQVFLLSLAAGSVSAQEYTDDPGHKAFAEVASVRFSVPKRFTVEKMPDVKISFMRRAAYQIAEFVAVPDGSADKEYLMDLSTKIATQMFPKQKPFTWRVIRGELMIKKSKFQTDSGSIRGINDTKDFVLMEYVVLKVKGHNIVVGYATSFGRIADPKWLFEHEGPAGASMPGLYALAHIIVSITGEKYTDINSGITLAVPQ